MAMTMEKRLEEASEAIRRYIKDTGDANNPDMYATIALPVAFPEMFDGTAWLAPVELSAADRLRGRAAMADAIEDQNMSRADAFGEGFKAVRDAHLSPETDAKVEG